MNELSRTQFVLLILLVTFVVSIATGIMTASLLHEAPQITQTVNRVVERTVERVSSSDNQSASVEPVEEVTVIEKDDAVTRVVSRFRSYSVKLFEDGEFVTRGVFVPDQSLVVVPEGLAEEESDVTVQFRDGTEIEGTLRADENGVAVVEFGEEAEAPDHETFETTSPVYGETVVHIGGGKEFSVWVGRVSQILEGDPFTTVVADLSVPAAEPGSMLVTLTGEVVGMATATAGQYIHFNELREMVVSGQVEADDSEQEEDEGEENDSSEDGEGNTEDGDMSDRDEDGGEEGGEEQ